MTYFVLCIPKGFLAYFCIMLSFVFLAICSLDFLLKFKQKAVRSSVRRLSLALAVLAVIGLRFLVSLAQDSKLPKHFKPGMGEDYCWFDGRLNKKVQQSLISNYLCIFSSHLGYFDLLLRTHCTPPDIQHCMLSQGVLFHLRTATRYSVHIGHSTENRQDAVRFPKSCFYYRPIYLLYSCSFYAFSAYIVGVFAVWIREIVVYIMARVREHFFIIDFWSGICILGLAIAGFILLLGKNLHVKSWWAINV